MQDGDKYNYIVFSRRIGNMAHLERFKNDIIRFYVEHYGEDPIDEHVESVEYGIIQHWAGAILVFADERAVGFINFSEVDPKKHIFDIGFTFVEEDHRREGIWTNMSRLVEVEARNMDARQLRRFISSDVEFLAEHLMLKDGYKAPAGDWEYHPLTRRL